MKQQSKLLLSLLHGAGVGAVLLSGTSLLSTDAVAGVSNTRHNLGQTTNTNFNRVTGGGTNEICVFCHTPHGADMSLGANNSPPLWNKRLDTTRTYTTYDQLGTTTFDAARQTNASTSVGSVSLACLSCHDGAQAMDNMINAPGSGGYNADGGDINGQTGGVWNWQSGAGSSTVTSEGRLTGAVTNLTTDLRNDHPIGIAYCGGGTTTYTPGTTNGCADADFFPIQLSGGVYYVESSGGAASRDKSDMILYTRSFGGTSTPSVECGSCHDPHVEAKATNQTAFMRTSQNQSGVCLACHNK